MAIIRGKIEHDREVVIKNHTFGKSNFVRCSCGKFKHIKTGEHIKSYTWEEFFGCKLGEIKCETKQEEKLLKEEG